MTKRDYGWAVEAPALTLKQLVAHLRGEEGDYQCQHDVRDGRDGQPAAIPAHECDECWEDLIERYANEPITDLSYKLELARATLKDTMRDENISAEGRKCIDETLRETRQWMVGVDQAKPDSDRTVIQ